MTPPRRTTPTQRIVGAVTQRLAYKAAALFFAVVLWFAVSAAEPTEMEVPVRFAPHLDPRVGTPTGVPAFRAVVTGRGRELLKLLASPPVLRPTFGPDTPLESRVELSAADVRLPHDVEAVVRELRPRSAVLHFTRTQRH